MQEIIKYFDIDYKKDEGELSLRLKEPLKIVDYQAEMIENNPVKSIIPFRIKKKDNNISICYKISSKIPLNQLIAENRIDALQMIKIIKKLCNIILNTQNLLLYEKCFLLDENYIYINASTLEPSMIYIPVLIETNFELYCRKFFENMLKGALNNETNNDASIDRILNYLKDNEFSVAEFQQLLTAKDSERIENHGIVKDDNDNVGAKRKISISSKISIPNAVKLEETIEIKDNKNIVIARILIQVLLIIVLAATALNFKMDAISIAGLIIIAIAADFAVLRKLR